MAAAQNPSVHLEAMEETENQAPKLETTGDTREVCKDGGEQPKGILVYGRNRSCEKSNNKRKTHTRRVL